MLENIKKMLFPKRTDELQDTTQDLINLKTISDNILINKTGDVFMIISLEAIPRELLSEREQTIQASKIISELNSETKPYRLIKIQGAVDISNITYSLLSLKQNASEKRKMLINEEVTYLDKLSTENSALTPQFYVTIWDKEKNVEQLKARAYEMSEKYKKAGVNAKVLELKEIVYLLTLYTDPVAALAEQDMDNVVEAVKAPVMCFSNDDGEEMWTWK